MQDFEKLGAFYLGKEFDIEDGQRTDNLLLYDARDLTTHGVILGMTGSGKTGLALSLLEEAAIDGIPAIAIDPKGDLGNLLLAFPELAPSDFRPWVDVNEAARKGMTPDEFAVKTAETWKRGLAEWGQDGARIQRLRDAAEVAIYTPGNAAGRPLQILRSFNAPPVEFVRDATALRDRIMSAVSGLLGLAGIHADPVQSREHILLSNILDHAWRAGRDLDIAALINEVQNPPFAKVGVFDLESFYPAKDRFGLAMALNNLIASPGFSAWMQGEPLDVQRLLFTPQGKPRLAILSIAHLSDAERMFFVTILLNEVLAWVRTQSGTGSLRALLYMDEIFGYFPPNANPPSKTPMLTLLKQARAFGVGVLLSTQNPVDLDYKGLSNAGTWWIGRLQTERDKMRVIEGLESAASGVGAGFDRGAMERLLGGLGKRVFLMRNVHDEAPVIFQTRWALSYLCGPMTLPQIKQAMTAHGAPPPVTSAAPAVPAVSALKTPSVSPPPAASPAVPAAAAPLRPSTRPVLPPEIPEYFIRPFNPLGALVYRPNVIGVLKLHFVHARAKVDTWTTRSLIAPVGVDGFVDWEAARIEGDLKDALEQQPQPGGRFTEVPPAAIRKKGVSQWQKTLKAHAYQHLTLPLFTCPEYKLTSSPGETEGDFRARLAQELRERRDIQMGKIKTKYTAKLQTLTDRVRRAEEKLHREEAQASTVKLSTLVGLGATLLGALTGRRVVSAGNVGRAASTMKNAGKIGKETADVERAKETLELSRQRLADMEVQFEEELATLQTQFEPGAVEVEKTEVRPRKSDITIGAVGLCWTPWPEAVE
ncbi:MAG: ATP-binding protein [Spartobacteria bacterium]|nr:ATP-binding protein [Spartobacteria bacterium]